MRIKKIAWLGVLVLIICLGLTKAYAVKPLLKRIVVPSEVKTTWSEVSIRIKYKKTNKTKRYKVKFNSNFKIPGTNLLVKVGAFMPDFTMTPDIITSRSNKPQCPALQVSIYEHETEKYKGWLFSKFPDMHPFEHPLISIHLEDKFDTTEAIRAKEAAEKKQKGGGDIIFAARNGDTPRVLALLVQGTKLNTKDEYGMTALMWATKNGRTEIVKLLEQAKEEKAKKEKAKKEKAKREEREKREAPANITASVKFSDASSYIPNKILDAGEESHVEFILKNEGKGIGFAVLLDITSDNPGIDISGANKNLGNIQPGETKKITIPIKGGLNLKTGESSFLIQAKEKRGYHSQKVKLTLQTAALIPPKLEIQSVEINDGKIGLARGNGNGIPENNETVELIAYIKNSGTGDALGVSLDLTSINFGLEVIKQKTNLGVIHPGQTIKGKLAFSIPRTFKANQLKGVLPIRRTKPGRIHATITCII